MWSYCLKLLNILTNYFVHNHAGDLLIYFAIPYVLSNISLSLVWGSILMVVLQNRKNRKNNCELKSGSVLNKQENNKINCLTISSTDKKRNWRIYENNYHPDGEGHKSLPLKSCEWLRDIHIFWMLIPFLFSPWSSKIE